MNFSTYTARFAKIIQHIGFKTQSQGNTMKKQYELGLFALMVIFVIIFYQTIFTHSISISYLGNFQIFNIIVSVQNELREWFTIFTENFNGHPFEEIKLLFWLDYPIQESINLKIFCILKSTFFLGFCFFYLKNVRENNITILCSLPHPFLPFHSHFHSNIFLMLSSLNHQQPMLCLCRHSKLSRRTHLEHLKNRKNTYF